MKNPSLIANALKVIFPLIKLEAFGEIGEEFKEATNNSIREVWVKLKPLFIEEVEELKDSNSKDVELLKEVEIMTRRKIRKEINADSQYSSLINELEEHHVFDKNESSYFNSNVINNSNISVGGNFTQSTNKDK